MFDLITSFPKTETERLILDELTLDDLHAFHEMRSDEKTMKYIPGRLAKSIDDSKIVIEKCMNWKTDGNNISWAIRFKENHQLIGTIGYYRIQWNNFRGEIGYILHFGYHGQGLMSEAIQAITKYGFNTLHFHTIEAVIDPDNLPSSKILLRNGFIQEGFFKENMFMEGKFYDSHVFTLHKSK